MVYLTDASMELNHLNMNVQGREIASRFTGALVCSENPCITKTYQQVWSQLLPRRSLFTRPLATTVQKTLNVNNRARINIIPVRLSGASRLSWPIQSWPMVHTTEDARVLAQQLDHHGRRLLLEQLQGMTGTAEDDEESEERERTATSTTTESTESLTTSELYRICLYNGLPFIGFGILDNGIMIVAGEYIDVTIGVGLGISTMAAAALGNLVSDVAGVGTTGYIELLVSKLGMTPVALTTTQSLSRSVRWAVALGRAVGIAIGCLIGMSPLLFFGKEDDEKKKKQESGDKSPPT